MQDGWGTCFEAAGETAPLRAKPQHASVTFSEATSGSAFLFICIIIFIFLDYKN